MLFFCSVPAKESTAPIKEALLEEYMAQIAKGDRDALGALYHQANTAVYSFALSILKNTSDAEDALHDCFLDIYQAAEHYRPQGKPMAWIFTIVRNRCLQKLRERTRTSDIPSEDWEPYLQSRESITPEDRLLIGTCMERLNQQERQIVVLHAVSGFRHREIAQLLQLPLPTVLSKYHRALKKLKKYVTEGGER